MLHDLMISVIKYYGVNIMDEYNFTYDFPPDFKSRVLQLLRQDSYGEKIATSFERCKYEYENLGLAYYAGMKGDNWDKKALDFTIEGTTNDIDTLKSSATILKAAISRALRPTKSGLLVREVLYLVSDMESFPATNKERFDIDVASANSVLSDLLKIGEKICSNATYRADSLENSMNDFFRDSLSFMGYTEVKDQTRHGISPNGKEAAEVDILIEKNGKEIAVFEGLKLNSVNSSYISTHIDKVLINYNTLGTATFMVAYVSTNDFESFWRKYASYLEKYEYPLQVKKQFETRAAPNAAIRIADMVLSKNGFDFPVYFIALNID